MMQLINGSFNTSLSWCIPYLLLPSGKLCTMATVGRTIWIASLWMAIPSNQMRIICFPKLRVLQLWTSCFHYIYIISVSQWISGSNVEIAVLIHKIHIQGGAFISVTFAIFPAGSSLGITTVIIVFFVLQIILESF